MRKPLHIPYTQGLGNSTTTEFSSDEYEFINAICDKISGQAHAHDIKPIAGGTRSKVYLVDAIYIIRISDKRDAAERFRTERSALELIGGSTSVSVPKYVASGSLSTYQWICTTFVPGKVLTNFWEELPDCARTRLLDQLAMVLVQLHTIQLDRYGYMGEDSEADEVGYLEAKLRKARKTAIRTGRYSAWEFDDYSARITEKMRRCYDVMGPSLCHGDLHPGNVVVSEGNVCLIDFEFCEGARYSLDFAREDYQDRLAVGFSARIKRSYLNLSMKNEHDFHRDCLLSRCIWKLVQSSQRANPTAALQDKCQLEQHLENL